MVLPLFRDFVEGPWRCSCYERCRASTRRRMDSALGTQLLPTFGHLPLDRIETTGVHRWFDEYSLTAPAGANRTLDVLRQILNFAVSCGHIGANPSRNVRRNRRPANSRFLSRAEVARLHSVLDAHRGRGSGRQQADVIRLLLFTGCRKGEIIGLRWSEVDGDVLRLRDSKTGPRLVYLNVQARAVLARQPRNESNFVFPSLDDPLRPRSSELSLWRKVKLKAGLGDVRLHDLRHTVGSHAVMAGAPIPVVSRLLGHRQPRMTLRYAHVGDRETEAAAERVGRSIAAVIGSPSDGRPNGASPAARPATGRPGSKPRESSSPPDFPAPDLTAKRAGTKLRAVMKSVNALELRQSLGKVLEQLDQDGAPILVYRRRKPAAALVSLKDYRERFVDREADERRRQVVREIRKLKFGSPGAATTLDLLRDLRA